MATNSSTPSVGSILVALGIVVALVVAALALQYGPTAAVDMVWGGLLGVLYIVIPVVVVAALLLGFFRFNAWRQSNP